MPRHQLVVNPLTRHNTTYQASDNSSSLDISLGSKHAPLIIVSRQNNFCFSKSVKAPLTFLFNLFFSTKVLPLHCQDKYSTLILEPIIHFRDLRQISRQTIRSQPSPYMLGGCSCSLPLLLSRPSASAPEFITVARCV